MDKKDAAVSIIQIVLSFLLAILVLGFVVSIFIGGAEMIHRFGPHWLIWTSYISFIVWAIPAVIAILAWFFAFTDSAWDAILWPVMWFGAIVCFGIFQGVVNLEYACSRYPQQSPA